MSATDSGRQRHLLAQAQALATEIRGSPMDPGSLKQSFPKLVELVRLVKRFVNSTAALPADGTRAMWEQRGQWLQEEVASLAQERVHSPDLKVWGGNLLQLLFAGADACDRVLREKVESDMALKAAGDEIVKLKQRCAQLEAAMSHASSQPPTDSNDEALELRSRVKVLQQEMERRNVHEQGLDHRLQLALKEREVLQRRVDELSSQVVELQDESTGRLEVLQAMMSKAEGTSSQSTNLSKDNAQLQQHCKTLSVNLETNAQVIEKLVELNTELMDQLNAATSSKQHEARSHGAAAPAARLPSSMPAGVPEQPTAAVSTTRPDGSIAISMASPPASVSAGGFVTQQHGSHTVPASFPSPYPVGLGSRPSPPLAPPPPPSLANAFEAFLTHNDDVSIKQAATAAVLAQPLQTTHGSNSEGKGSAHSTQGQKRTGVGGRVMGLFRYVAGSDTVQAEGNVVSNTSSNMAAGMPGAVPKSFGP